MVADGHHVVDGLARVEEVVLDRARVHGAPVLILVEVEVLVEVDPAIPGSDKIYSCEI